MQQYFSARKKWIQFWSFFLEVEKVDKNCDDKDAGNQAVTIQNAIHHYIFDVDTRVLFREYLSVQYSHLNSSVTGIMYPEQGCEQK